MRLDSLPAGGAWLLPACRVDRLGSSSISEGYRPVITYTVPLAPALESECYECVPLRQRRPGVSHGLCDFHGAALLARALLVAGAI